MFQRFLSEASAESDPIARRSSENRQIKKQTDAMVGTFLRTYTKAVAAEAKPKVSTVVENFMVSCYGQMNNTVSEFVTQDYCYANVWFGAVSSKNNSEKQSTGLFLQIVVTHFQFFFFSQSQAPFKIHERTYLPRKPGPRASRHFWAEK